MLVRSRHSTWLRTKTTFSLWLSLLQPTAIALSLTLVIVPPALALSATAGAILAAPERYDGQPVTLEGSVTHLSQRVSQRGNAYYTLDLRDGTGTIRIFSFGQTICADGMRATVDGTFERVKQVGRYTFSNEVTASRVTCR